MGTHGKYGRKMAENCFITHAQNSSRVDNPGGSTSLILKTTFFSFNKTVEADDIFYEKKSNRAEKFTKIYPTQKSKIQNIHIEYQINKHIIAMNQERKQTFDASISTQFTSNNLATRIKMPSISWSKTNQQQVSSQKIDLKEHENEAGNKLLSLHGKLRQEADKIRQWKLQKETELKMKEKKIMDSTQTIENLRKYILELQLQNENLSLKLQEVRSTREEMLQKVDSTRELCNILKEHVQTLKNKTIQCQLECNELKQQESRHFEKFRDLSLKFQNLNISATEEQNQLKSKLTEYSCEKEKVRKCLEDKVQDAERQNMMYAENVTQKESQINDITEMIKNNEKQKDQQEEMIVQLKSNIENLKYETESKEIKTEQLIKEVDSLTKSKCELNKEYEEAQLYLSKIQKSYKSLRDEMSEQNCQNSHELETLQLEGENVKEQYEKLKERHQELNIKQTNSIKHIEDLKSDKDILILEKANLDNSLKNEIKSKSELKITLEKKNYQVENLNRCIKELNNKLDIIKAEYSKDVLELKESKKLSNDLESDVTQIIKEKELLKKELNAKTAEYVHLEDKLNFLEKTKELEMEQSNKDLTEIKYQNSQLIKDLSDIEIKLKLDEEKYQNHINELEKCKLDNNVTIDKYKSKQDQLQSQIKDCQQNIHQLEEELNQYKMENEALLIDKQTFENMTKQKEAAERETKQTINNCEIRKQEMMSTLEKYKKENQKIIDIKEKEIETIYAKNELQNKKLENKFNNDLKEKTNKWEKENQKLKDKIFVLNREIALQRRENNELQIKIDKTSTNNETTNNIPKTPVFHSSQTPQRTVMVTPQQVTIHTPLLKAKPKISRKRKVVFNPEKASFISDTDSSISEYALISHKNRQSNCTTEQFVFDNRVQSKIKENVKENVHENLLQSKSQLKGVNESENKTVNILSKEIYDEIQPKRTRSRKKTFTQNLKTTTKSEISKSPMKGNKNKKSEDEIFWFDTDFPKI